MPEYDSLISTIKGRITTLEGASVSEILAIYKRVLDDLVEQLGILTSEIEAIKSRRESITETQLYTETRLRIFINKVITEIERFNRLAAGLIVTAQEQAITQAILDSKDLIKSLYGDYGESSEFAASFLNFDRRAVRNLIGTFIQTDYVKQILDASTVEVAQAITNVFVRNLVLGLPPRDTADELEKKFGIPALKATTTARTEILNAYRNGNLESYRLSQTVKAWQWSATLDRRTCPVCIALDGREFPLETPFATHPQCRCSPLPVTRTFEELGIEGLEEPIKPDFGPRGEEWLKRQSASIQKQILGVTKFDMYKSGRLKLNDLVETRTHPVYGQVREERTIKRLKQLGKI